MRRSRRGPRGGGATVAADWQRWIAENCLRGVEPDDLVAGLVDAGVPRTLARATVGSIRRSPLVDVARAAERRSQRRALVGRLLDAMHGALEVPRVPAPGPAEFFAAYWSGSRPAIFTDIVPGWRQRWTPSYLRARFGEVPVEACIGRERDPRPDVNWREHRVELPLAEFIDRMLAADRSNDLYLIANNHNTSRPSLQPLWDDVVLPAGWFDEANLARGSALWLGPAGTITPLHHDTSNILLCQTEGRKRVVLAPPWTDALLDTARGVYNQRTPDDLARAQIDAAALVLEPGEALFIPAGWWHDVRSLDVSVSLALNAFARGNRFDWYAPGAIR